MEVKLGPYKNWFGPYQLAELLCWWAKPTKDEHGFGDKPQWVHKFGEWLAYGSVEPPAQVGEIRPWGDRRPKTWLYKLLEWIESKRTRQIKVRIDPWDSWSADYTLALIILPLLKQLHKTKQGAPLVDDGDVPDHLKSTNAEPKENDWDTDSNHFLRWDWVLQEMIWAFQQKLDDSWEDQFETGTNDLHWKQLPGGMTEMIPGPLHTKHYDWPARKQYEQRIQRGFLLFGKYYQNLWD